MKIFSFKNKWSAILALLLTGISFIAVSCQDCGPVRNKTLSGSVQFGYKGEFLVTVNGEAGETFTGYIQLSPKSDNISNVYIRSFSANHFLLSIDDDVELGGKPYDVRFDHRGSGTVTVDGEEFPVTGLVFKGWMKEGKKPVTRCSFEEYGSHYQCDIQLEYILDGDKYVIGIPEYISAY